MWIQYGRVEPRNLHFQQIPRVHSLHWNPLWEPAAHSAPPAATLGAVSQPGSHAACSAQGLAHYWAHSINTDRGEGARGQASGSPAARLCWGGDKLWLIWGPWVFMFCFWDFTWVFICLRKLYSQERLYKIYFKNFIYSLLMLHFSKPVLRF